MTSQQNYRTNDSKRALMTMNFVEPRTDFSKCFDRISLPIALSIWRKLGTPEGVVTLIGSFYSEQFTYFQRNGATSDSATKRTCGLLQGCPFSVLILATTMTAYWQYLPADTDCDVYIDDRLMLAKNAEQLDKLVHYTHTFDIAMWWQ